MFNYHWQEVYYKLSNEVYESKVRTLPLKSPKGWLNQANKNFVIWERQRKTQ